MIFGTVVQTINGESFDVIDTFFQSLGKTSRLESKIMDSKSQPSGRKCKNLPHGWKCNEKQEIPAVNIIQAQEILFIHYLKTSWTVAYPLLFSIPLLQVTLILYDFNPLQTKPNYM